VRQLEHRVGDPDANRARTLVRRQQAAQDIRQAREDLQRPFKHAQDLDAARRQRAAITQQMQTATAAPAAAEDTPAPPAPDQCATPLPGRKTARGEEDTRPSRQGPTSRPGMLGSHGIGCDPARPRSRRQGPGHKRPATPTTTPAKPPEAERNDEQTPKAMRMVASGREDPGPDFCASVP
jgi:hypothetical protein